MFGEFRGELPLGWWLGLGSAVITAIVKNYFINQHESINFVRTENFRN